jgi:hypothetical protein
MSSRVMRAGRAVPAAASIASARALGGPADSGQFFPPAPHQLALGLVALSLAGRAGGHAPGTVGGVAPALALGLDLGRPFRVGLHDLVGDAGGLPVLEPPRPPRVRLDRVTELHGDARCREPSGPWWRRAGALATTRCLSLSTRPARPSFPQDLQARRGRAGTGHLPERWRGGCGRRRAHRSAWPRPARHGDHHFPGHPVEVAERRVSSRVHDPVHVLGLTDHPDSSTLLWAEMTTSIPGLRVCTRRSLVRGSLAPPCPKTAS